MNFAKWVLIISRVCVIFMPSVQGLGVNWGTMATHKLPPEVVVQMLKDNGIEKVKLFDADASTMSEFTGSDIEVMIAIPNDQLAVMASSHEAAQKWVRRNVTRYMFKGGVNIKYVAVGNEPFLNSYNGTFLNVTLPALVNIQNALKDANFGDTIKATVPLNADVYDSPQNNSMPSAGAFRTDIFDLMKQLIEFLDSNKSPFTVNIYPFLSLYGNDDFPIDYAFFDGVLNPVIDTNNGIQYRNVFDANFDTLVSALKSAGHGDMPILVGEIGWPTNGDKNGNILYAARFYNGLLAKLAKNVGTPLRPGGMEVFLFSLLDEDAKSIAPGGFERHWGIMKYDGQPKFPMDLSGQGQNRYLVGAKGVSYMSDTWCVFNNDTKADQSALADNVNFACTYSDCTALGYGSSCNNLDANGNASYAFNMYYQVQNQNDLSCNFQGLAKIVTQNVSTLDCNFLIQIGMPSSSFLLVGGSNVLFMNVAVFCYVLLVL